MQHGFSCLKRVITTFVKNIKHEERGAADSFPIRTVCCSKGTSLRSFTLFNIDPIVTYPVEHRH
jgi:hypothetical protein